MAAAVDFQNQPQTDDMQDQPGKMQLNESQQQNQEQNQQHHQQQQQHHSSSQPAQQQATAGIPGKDDERKLFIGGLSRNTTDKELRDHFGKFGEIESISVKVDPHTGISRGFAFMVFTNPKTIDKLLASGEHYINKRKVREQRYHTGCSTLISHCPLCYKFLQRSERYISETYYLYYLVLLHYIYPYIYPAFTVCTGRPEAS